jgi:glycerophosphoryl diester phosphodiesterase
MFMAPILVRKCEHQAFQVPLRYGRINIIDEKFLNAAHKREIAVHVWTINEKEQMEWLVDLGVDGVFTDKPALFKEVLQEKGFL